MRVEILFSRDLSKKRKSWLEGEIILEELGKNVVKIIDKSKEPPSTVFSNVITDDKMSSLKEGSDVQIGNVLIQSFDYPVKNIVNPSLESAAMTPISSNLTQKLLFKGIKPSMTFKVPKSVISDNINASSMSNVEFRTPDEEIKSVVVAPSLENSSQGSAKNVSKSYILPSKPFKTPSALISGQNISKNITQSATSTSISRTTGGLPASQSGTDCIQLSYETKTERLSRIPISFSTANEYAVVWSHVLIDEIVRSLNDGVNQIDEKCKSIPQSITMQMIQKGQALQKLGVFYMDDVEISLSIPNYGENFSFKRKHNACEDTEAAERLNSIPFSSVMDEIKLYMKFTCNYNAPYVKNLCDSCGRGDIWLLWVQDSAEFMPWLHNKTKRENVWIVKSMWHGLSRDNSTEVMSCRGYGSLVSRSDSVNNFMSTQSIVYHRNLFPFWLRKLLNIHNSDDFNVLQARTLLKKLKFCAVRISNEPCMFYPLDIFSPSYCTKLNIPLVPQVGKQGGLQCTSLWQYACAVSPICNLVLGQGQPKSANSLPVKQVNMCLLSLDEVKIVKDKILNSFLLNIDQIAVLDEISSWYVDPQAASNILLIHGVFGSGKSHLIAAICVFIKCVSVLINQKDRFYKAGKVFISAHTNIAVDRLLTQLVSKVSDDIECPRVVRIGNVSKVDKQLRKYMVMQNDSANAAKREVERLLKEEARCNESSPAVQTLKELLVTASTDDYSKKQAARVQSADVIGVTCASSYLFMQQRLKKDERKPNSCDKNESMDLSEIGNGVLILDEASQLIEPLSLLPLVCSLPSKLIVVGDPKQLPPVVSNDSSTDSTGSESSILRTLFDRLKLLSEDSDRQCNIKYFMLRTQYRCHPKISNICSVLFYERKLFNGLSALQRKILVDNLDPCSIVNISDVETVCGSSFVNVGEAATAVQIISLLLSNINSNCAQNSLSIGIICMYRAQVILLTSLLNRSTKLREFVVDSPPQWSSMDSYVTLAEQYGNMFDKTYRVSDHCDGVTIKVSTVDAFQGQELDIVIICCSRRVNTDFIRNGERINVALSRAKNHFIVLGSVNTLCVNGEAESQEVASSGLWNRIIRMSKLFANYNEFALSLKTL